MSEAAVIGFDTTEFHDMVQEVLAETAALNQSLTSTEDRAEHVDRTVRAIIRENEAGLRRTIRAARQTATIIRGFYMVAGESLGEATAAYVEAAILSAEILLDIALAESLTIVGAVRGVPKAFLALSLIGKAQALKRQNEENQRTFEGLITIFGALSY